MSQSLPARFFLGLLTLYRWLRPPFAAGHCRYQPTCSEYAADAVRAHGAWAGSWMAFARLCRCQPLGQHGFDPVPRETQGRWWKPWAYGVWRMPRSDKSFPCPSP